MSLHLGSHLSMHRSISRAEACCLKHADRSVTRDASVMSCWRHSASTKTRRKATKPMVPGLGQHSTFHGTYITESCASRMANEQDHDRNSWNTSRQSSVIMAVEGHRWGKRIGWLNRRRLYSKAQRGVRKDGSGEMLPTRKQSMFGCM